MDNFSIDDMFSLCDFLNNETNTTTGDKDKPLQEMESESQPPNLSDVHGDNVGEWLKQRKEHNAIMQ